MRLVTAPRLLVLAASLVALGCGDDGGDGGDLADGPLYLVQTRVFTPDSTTGLLVPTGSLDGEPNYATAIEQAGGGVLYADEGIGTFLIGSGEEPVITRFELVGDRLVEGERLSFANHGVAWLYAGSVAFVSPTKAYYFDLDQLQAIAFDPTAMAITGAVSLAGANREGFFTAFGDVVVRDDGLYFPAQWYVDPEYDRVPAGAVLVHLDPATDEVAFTSDARCTGMLMGMTTADGDAYWFSDFYNAFARRGYGADRGVPDCGLRLKAGETTFDPEWELDTAARLGAETSVPMLQAGEGKLWLRALDEELADLPSPADYHAMDTAPAWQWHLLDVVGDAPPVRNDERPPSAVGSLGMYVDGRSFSTVENEDYSETILLELTEDGFVTRGTYQGVIDEIVRVR